VVRIEQFSQMTVYYYDRTLKSKGVGEEDAGAGITPGSEYYTYLARC